MEISAYSFKCSKTRRNYLTSGCYFSTVISKAGTQPQPFEIFNPTYNEIPNPTREMREVNLPEPDDPLNPEKWEVECNIRHPKSVQQGPSTAIVLPDLRSKQGEFQHKTVQSLRHSTARSTSSHHTRWISKPYTWWGTRPPHAVGGTDWPPSHPSPSQRAGLSQLAQKQRGKNHLPDIQELGWKKCV